MCFFNVHDSDVKINYTTKSLCVILIKRHLRLHSEIIFLKCSFTLSFTCMYLFSGSKLKASLIKQYYHPPPNNMELFGTFQPTIDLNAVFQKKRARFNKRTSSAHWDTPIMKPGLLGRH